MLERKHSLGFFSILMITVSSVDSLRNLPSSALFGWPLIFFFVFAAIGFLLPCSLVMAELGTMDPKTPGGIYAWVKRAFGPQIGFLTIWLQWIETVFWFPTILSFIAATIGYLVNPALASNKLFLCVTIITLFWGITWLNCRGIKLSSLFTNICGSFGIFIPMGLLITLGGCWIFSGKPLAMTFHAQSLLPSLGSLNSWISLVAILLAYTGIEIAASHTPDMQNPEKNFPKTLFMAGTIVVIILILASLVIALVTPADQISLVAGIIETLAILLKAFHLQSLLPLVAFFLVLGPLASVNNWALSPSKAILAAAKEGLLPTCFSKTNARGMPANLLIFQAILVTLICSIFLLMPTINSSYWLLTALLAQLYMIMYALIFLAGMTIRLREPESPRPFKVKGGVVGFCLIAGVGLTSTLVTFFVSFTPPSQLALHSTNHFDMIITCGLLLLTLPALLFATLKTSPSPT